MPHKVAPQPMATPRATKNPTCETDKISPLGGEFDMSLPVDAVEPLVGADWIAVRTFPHYLRRGGWIYLRTDGHLQARVKVTKVVWLPERKVPTLHAYENQGPGLALLVDPRTWDLSVDHGLGALAEQQRVGYRYLKTNEDGTVTHYIGRRPVDTETGKYADHVNL